MQPREEMDEAVDAVGKVMMGCFISTF